MSIATIKTIAFSGIDAVPIDVQVHIGAGLPFFTIVGLPDKTISEAKERIRAAFDSLGLSLPGKRITINMSPASLQKEGTHYDLPIAVGVLVAMGIIPPDAVENWLILGELNLSGGIEKIPGALIAGMYANAKQHTLICPLKSAAEAKLAAPDLQIVPVQKLIDLISFVKGEYVFASDFPCDFESEVFDIDMAQVKGQGVAKRALEIAAAGGFHVLLIGAPGVGKSMLAKRMLTIMPELSALEAVEVMMVYSVANKLGDGVLKLRRPYRDPHHSASLPALVGGGAQAKPGEISLAHNGILFLDEFAEYSKALEGLRQCMESGEVMIARANNHVRYPARAQVIAAMNPCKCGYYGTMQGCKRGPSCVKEYQNKISGPILDRFDMVVYMDNEKAEQNSTKEETSSVIRTRVVQARKFAETIGVDSKGAVEELGLSSDAHELLMQFCEKKQLSRRSYHKIARVARVIANLAHSKTVQKEHVAEAMMYRMR